MTWFNISVWTYAIPQRLFQTSAMQQVKISSWPMNRTKTYSSYQDTINHALPLMNTIYLSLHNAILEIAACFVHLHFENPYPKTITNVASVQISIAAALLICSDISTPTFFLSEWSKEYRRVASISWWDSTLHYSCQRDRIPLDSRYFF